MSARPTAGVLPAFAGLPPWLLWGGLYGLVASLAIAGVFYAGTRLFPTEHEERAWDGESRRHVEIRQYLDAIGEQYAERHPVEGQEVAFYLPKRDVAITFDARAFYRIERSPTDAVLVEHELPGVHLGHRLPFETPELDFGAVGEDGPGGRDGSGGVDPVNAACAVLGVPSTATATEIKTAYREKVKEVHPDHGGDIDEFERVREAYATAKKHTS